MQVTPRPFAKSKQLILQLPALSHSLTRLWPSIHFIKTIKRNGDNTQPWWGDWNATLTTNGFNLLLLTRTQTSQYDFSGLVKSGMLPSTLYLLQKLPKAFLERSGRILFRGRQSKRRHLMHAEKTSEIIWIAKIWSVMLWSRRKSHCVFFSLSSIISWNLSSRHLAYPFQGKLRMKMSWCLVHSFLFPFLCT